MTGPISRPPSGWSVDAPRFAKSLGRWLAGLTFPALALIALAVIWAVTLHLIRIERANTEVRALAVTRELVETYEAQVVRAVREIDLTLKSVKYAYERGGGSTDLAELGDRELLPPDLVFVVSIADRDGAIVESTRPLMVSNVADRRYFQEQRLSDSLSAGRLRRDVNSTEWSMQFARRLEDTTGSFAGVALVSVAADFFVSGYEEEKLGAQGVLGLLGTDGVFRARRSGETVAFGEAIDYSIMMPSPDEDGSHSALSPPAALPKSGIGRPWCDPRVR